MNPLTRPLLSRVIVLTALALVATVAFGQGITIDLGKTTAGRYIELVGNTPGSDGEITDLVYLAPEYAARNKGTAMYFALADSFFYALPAGERVLVNVEYYDAPGVEIRLVYDAQANHAGKEHAQSIMTTGSNTWKSKSLTLDDAYFGNGLAHGADFKLVAASGTMTINAVSVVPFEAYYNYGAVTDSLNMCWRDYQGGDSQTEIVTKEGEECVATLRTDNYLYVDVADPFIWGGNHPYLFLSVEYFDTAMANSRFRIQYDAVTNIFMPTPYVYGKGWNSFRTYTFELPDAFFANRWSPLTDFRLHIPTPGLAINRIMIARLSKRPLPVTNIIPGFTAYKALEPPVVDGKLTEWDWLAPSAILQQVAGNGSRSDEFYRSWMLNSANLPVAEPGEPGVTDPGTPGSWDVKDLGGGVRVLWDDQNLYFAANIRDNVVSASGADWSNRDGFGFYIDISHDYDATGTAPLARKDDPRFTQGEHFFFFPAAPGQAGTWCHSTAQEGEALPAGVQSAAFKTDSGYVIEGALPLRVIADGLTWHPGVAGDKDAYNPLFAWMVNDNDAVGASSGRVMWGGHSADDEFWGTLNMAPIPQVDRGIMVDPGTTNYESFLKQVETQAGADGITTPAVRGGKTGVMLSSGYLYLDINDTVWNETTHKHALVSVEYFDSASTGARFRLQYESDSTIYHSLPYVNITNTNTWKTATFEVKNAHFQSHQNGRADFRFNNGSKDVVLNQVKVAMADLWIDLGDTTAGYGIVESNLAGDGLRAPVTVGGVNCKRNDMGYTNTARYFYHAVNDSVIYNGNHKQLFVTVEYYDTTSSGGVGMNYDGMGATWSTGVGDAFITGTSQWKLHTFFLPDAKFGNKENGKSDFRITGTGSGTTFINRILVGSLDSLKVLTGIAGREPTPLTFSLDQNYPNPFNPTTTIRYSLPHRSHVTLTVFNTLGQLVTTLVDGETDAGPHEVQFKAGRVASGVYFYRFQAEAFNQVRSMILVR